MPNFNIIKKANIKNTYRTEAVKSIFDLSVNKIIERFEGKLELSDDWQIGLIVGNSGTGKTIIAKNLFKKIYMQKYEYNKKSVVDDMPEDSNIKEIVRIFNVVGFSSPPSWLKPYSVLSEGEKMRVDIARVLLLKKMAVIDEYTSVVDRNVARIASKSISRAIRETSNKIIFVSCHYDIIKWLCPDWIFNTNNMKQYNTRGRLRSPEIKLYIRKCDRKLWRLFRKYHYLSGSISNSAQCYIAEYNNNPVAFTAVIHHPHNRVKNFKRAHRTVVLPDYQGVGIGSGLSSFIANYYVEKGYRFISITSHPAFINYRNNSKKWILKRFGRNKTQGEGLKTKGWGSKKRITTSWEYIGNQKQ